MFVKLRTAKYMKAKATNSEASVEFVGKVQRMARVHHYGLRDCPARGAKEVPYDERPLLGVNDTDLKIIELLIMEKLRVN